MKQVTSSVFIISSLVAVAMGGLQEFIEKHKDKSDTCVEKSNFQEENVLPLLKGEMEVSHEGKCYLDCLLVELGVMVDGKFSVETAKHHSDHYYADNEEKREKAYKIIDECAAEATSDDECEAAHQLFLCFKSKREEHGFDEED
ncbi:general odorant-binding protein 28a [Anabrus simplex]|uniref:general odorant-binding protein 28a n=1 Tax=Anabrus simplex TaxID=316456 RepID=UPI0034DD0471